MSSWPFLPTWVFFFVLGLVFQLAWRDGSGDCENDSMGGGGV